ncbi:MAG TPA: hypothetical protein VFL90_16965 [Methylomirabilota bacterium]|nr:hypothetical protein [Methylomirabilota bacterium]
MVQRPPQPDLPPTPELLLMRRGGGTSDAAAEPRAAAAPPATPASEALLRSRAIVEAELAERLGPMAQLVCGEHLAAASGVNDLVERLAREIHDGDKAARFKERARERLAAVPPRS